MTIPARAHFCWIGPRLPWAYVFAVLSAAERSELPEIILHHTDELADGAALRALLNTPRVRLSRIDAAALLTQVGNMLGAGGALASLYLNLGSPVIQSDVLRGAILYLHGGIYLDLDTVTTSSLLTLLDAAQFIGCEYIVWPRFVRQSRSPIIWARHLALDLLRKALRRHPNGWRIFRRVQTIYFRGINGAIMGAPAKSSLVSDYLRAMILLTAARRTQAYALGPELLQEVVDRYEGEGLTIHEPEVFYPLPPEISEHWFRFRGNVRLDAVLSANTRVVHWYASVRTKALIAGISPDYVRRHQKQQLYSALVCSCIARLPEMD